MTSQTTTRDVDFEIIPGEHGIVFVYLCRTERANSLGWDFFHRFPVALRRLSHDPSVTSIVIQGKGSVFCGGIHLKLFTEKDILQKIHILQQAITAIEECPKPVIASIHGPCIGAGVDLVTACDLRYASEYATFSVKEIDLGIVADLGTLQRLGRIVGDGVAREMCFTARNVAAKEAGEFRLLNKVFPTRAECDQHISQLCQVLSQKSPTALAGTKQMLLHARENSIHDGLNISAQYNQTHPPKIPPRPKL